MYLVVGRTLAHSTAFAKNEGREQDSRSSSKWNPARQFESGPPSGTQSTSVYGAFSTHLIHLSPNQRTLAAMDPPVARQDSTASASGSARFKVVGKVVMAMQRFKGGRWRGGVRSKVPEYDSQAGPASPQLPRALLARPQPPSTPHTIMRSGPRTRSTSTTR
jgi:hypothetical protein